MNEPLTSSGPAYDFRKYPKARGLSWPIKRSVVDAQLVGSGVVHLGSMRFQMGSIQERESKLVARAAFERPHSPRTGLGVAWFSSLAFYAVPSQRRHDIGGQLTRGALARICDWLASASAAPATWQTGQHRLDVHYDDSGLIFRAVP